MTCSNWQASKIKQEIGDRVTHYRTVRGADHGFWGGKEKTDIIFKELSQWLINPEGK